MRQPLLRVSYVPRSIQPLLRPTIRKSLADGVLMQYSQAVRAGNYVYTSGSVGMTKEGKMVEGSVRTLPLPTYLYIEAQAGLAKGTRPDSTGHLRTSTTLSSDLT